MTGNESGEELVALESECLRRFRARAAQIKAQNPLMSEKVAFCKAVEGLKQTSDKYSWARTRLMFLGVPAQPLR
jgi:hypothetical protein